MIVTGASYTGGLALRGLVLVLRLRRLLAQAPPAVFTLVAALAGFSTYFCMYAFRKPFAAATFDHVPGWGFAIDYKVALVISQVLGYALSKFIGVKVISEIKPKRRAGAILLLIGASWLALLAFALIPAPWNVVALFFNGLPLGMIWGLVYGFMEGRRQSELLGAVLCSSFILSSGVVKSVGVWLMQSGGVSAFWMPAATGACFMPLLAVSVLALSALPPPNAQDEAARVRRAPMTGAQRIDFLRAYGPGLIALVLAYVLLTALRDYRDNFAAEIWAALGFAGEARVFSASEVPVAIISLAGLGAVIAVRDNRLALAIINAMVVVGFMVLGISTLAFQARLISPLVWMILAGSGLYIAYNPVNAVLFDRLVAASGRIANAGFLIYVADSSGYMGSVALLLWRNFGQKSLNWLQFFINGSYIVSILGTALSVLAAIYFHWRTAPSRSRKASDAAFSSALPISD